MATTDTFMTPETVETPEASSGAIDFGNPGGTLGDLGELGDEKVETEEVPSINILLQEMENNFGWQQIGYNLGESETPSLEDMKALLEMFRQVNYINEQMRFKADRTVFYAKIHDNRINDFVGFTPSEKLTS